MSEVRIVFVLLIMGVWRVWTKSPFSLSHFLPLLSSLEFICAVILSSLSPSLSLSFSMNCGNKNYFDVFSSKDFLFLALEIFSVTITLW